MIKINENTKVWITSDTHYGHKNICRGVTNWRLPDGSVPIDQTRDFDTIERMNESIIRNINSVVGQDDVLIHLGDWSFGGFDNIEIFRNSKPPFKNYRGHRSITSSYKKQFIHTKTSTENCLWRCTYNVVHIYCWLNIKRVISFSIFF